jgi:hypothetical protein
MRRPTPPNARQDWDALLLGESCWHRAVWPPPAFDIERRSLLAKTGLQRSVGNPGVLPLAQRLMTPRSLASPIIDHFHSNLLRNSTRLLAASGCV